MCWGEVVNVAVVGGRRECEVKAIRQDDEGIRGRESEGQDIRQSIGRAGRVIRRIFGCGDGGSARDKFEMRKFGGTSGCSEHVMWVPPISQSASQPLRALCEWLRVMAKFFKVQGKTSVEIEFEEKFEDDFHSGWFYSKWLCCEQCNCPLGQSTSSYRSPYPYSEDKFWGSA